MFQFIKRKNDRLVKWAMPGEMIPLKCGGCDAVFMTVNEGPLGGHEILFGDNEQKCSECKAMKHNVLQLVPNKKLYNQGRWQ